MKLFKTTVILTVAALFVFVGCEKGEFTNNPEPDKPTEKVYSKKGILVFKNHEAYLETINKLSDLSYDKRKAWEQSMGFKSVFSIYNEIVDSEIALEEKLYAGYDEELSKNELRNLGLPVDRHSDIYIKYLKKGLIKEVIEKDGSEAFYMNVLDPIAAHYTNENGLLVINDTLYQYTSEEIKLMPGNVSDKEVLMASRKTNKAGSIYVLNLREKETIDGYNWSQSSGWKYESSSKRYRMDIYGWSWTYGPSDTDYMGCKFWPELKAERKRWGNWKQRNSYTPINRLTASWSYKYTLSENWFGGYPDRTYYNNLSGGGKSPIDINYFGANHGYYKYCNPTGNWSGGSQYFKYPVSIVNYNFKAYFDGGTITLTR